MDNPDATAKYAAVMQQRLRYCRRAPQTTARIVVVVVAVNIAVGVGGPGWQCGCSCQEKRVEEIAHRGWVIEIINLQLKKSWCKTGVVVVLPSQGHERTLRCGGVVVIVRCCHCTLSLLLAGGGINAVSCVEGMTMYVVEVLS